MLLSARRLSGLLAAALVLSVGLTGVGVAPASAWTGPPPVPITVPGNAYPPIGSVDRPLSDPDSFNRALSRNPMNYVSNPAATLMEKGAKAYAGLEALDMTYTLSVGPITSLTGGVTSGNLWCDLSMRFTGSEECAIGPVEGYVPNSDIGDPAPPGWTGKVMWEALWVGCNQVASTTCNLWGPRVTSTGVLMEFSSDYQPGMVTPMVSLPGNPLDVFAELYYDGKGVQNDSQYTLAGYRDAAEGQLSYAQTIKPWVGTQTGRTRSYAPGESTHMVPMPTVEFLMMDHFIVYEGWDKNNVVARWYPPGHALRPESGGMNPLRHFETRWTCSTGVEGVARSDGFREDDQRWAQIPAGECAEGTVTKYQVFQITEGAEEQSLYLWLAPYNLIEWAAQNPTPGPVDLAKSQPGGRPAVSCFDDPDQCSGWFDDAAKDGTYHCTQDGKELPLEACNPYRPTFDPQYEDQGIKYADPEGNLPKPTTPATPELGTDSGGGCFPRGWGVMNPAEWIFKPLTCALDWAFIPDAGFASNLIGDVQLSLSGVAPFSVISAIPGVVGSIGQGYSGGCAAMPNFSAIDGLELKLPCEPPQSAAWTTARTLMVIILWTTVAISAWHMVSRSVGGKE